MSFGTYISDDGISVQSLANSLVAFFKGSDTIPWVGVEGDLQISVV